MHDTPDDPGEEQARVAASARRGYETGQRNLMHYLIAYSSMPEPYGKFVWSPNIENATPFPSSVAAEAKRSTVADAMGVIEHDGRWYIVKE